MGYNQYKSCANCKFTSRVNFVDNAAIDSWCNKHNTNFIAGSKCDYWDLNKEMGEPLKSY